MRFSSTPGNFQIFPCLMLLLMNLKQVFIEFHHWFSPQVFALWRQSFSNTENLQYFGGFLNLFTFSLDIFTLSQIFQFFAFISACWRIEQSFLYWVLSLFRAPLLVLFSGKVSHAQQNMRGCEEFLHLCSTFSP